MIVIIYEPQESEAPDGHFSASSARSATDEMDISIGRLEKGSARVIWKYDDQPGFYHHII